MEKLINIRKAQAKDSLNIAQVHIKSWRETYQSIFSAEFLKQLNLEKRQNGWIETLANRNKQVYVAEVDHSIVGFCSFEIRQYHGKPCAFLATLYILQDYQMLSFQMTIRLQICT